MEINPSLARLQQLQAQDGVQMQREAAPDDELAGCPGCPYFWTCPVPHRGREVRAPEEIDLEDVEDQLGPRTAYRPRDVEDIGWTDQWVEVDEDELELADEDSSAGTVLSDDDVADADPPAPRERRGLRSLFRRRG